jgi:hypothetical protein
MSFANAAADAGWATLSYDRLGTGQSAHPDGTNVVQTGYEIAQSIAISKGLREGTLSEHVPSHEHIVGIGHCQFKCLRSPMANRLTGSVWVCSSPWCHGAGA